MRYLDVLASLNRNRVRYVVVGGMAVIMHGVPRTTKDIDLLVDLSPENVAALAVALEQAGYRPKVPVRVIDLSNEAIRNEWIEQKGMKALMFWKTASGDIDVLVASPVDFGEAARGATTYEVEGTSVPIASIESLIAMKRFAGRPHDLSDINALERIRLVSDQQGETWP